MLRISQLHLSAAVRTTPTSVAFVSSAEKSKEVALALAKEGVIGVDCEGVMLGRFGQLCTIQIATERGDA